MFQIELIILYKINDDDDDIPSLNLEKELLAMVSKRLSMLSPVLAEVS